jgi:hypothetical protein
VTARENPAPRANAEGRADAKIERCENRGLAGDCNGRDARQTDVREGRAALLRDFISEALAPVENDALAARFCLKNDDDTGARYHLKRVVVSVKAAALTFRELEALRGGE